MTKYEYFDMMKKILIMFGKTIPREKDLEYFYTSFQSIPNNHIELIIHSLQEIEELKPNTNIIKLIQKTYNNILKKNNNSTNYCNVCNNKNFLFGIQKYTWKEITIPCPFCQINNSPLNKKHYLNLINNNVHFMSAFDKRSFPRWVYETFHVKINGFNENNQLKK